VNLDLTPEQQAFQAAVRAFARDQIAPVAREWEHAGRYPTEIVAGLRALGLFGLTVPEAHGGLGADLVSYAIAFEEIARCWMGIGGILGSHTLSCWLLARFGTEAQKRRWLPELASGARRTGIALTEPGAGTDLQAITTRATRDGDHYVLRGTKTWITNARHADPLPVLCVTDPGAQPRHRGLSVLLVEAGTPGFQVGRDLGKLGYKGPESCEVHFEAARVPAEHLVGGVEGQGFKQVVAALEVGRLNIAGRSLGIAQAALDAALRYSRERQAFGQPIGDFQAVQLRLADLATEVQAARLLTWWAAARKDAGHRTDRETAMAKLFASELALKAALDSMRIHGAYGYSTEFEIERLYRDAPLMAIGEGTNDVLRVLIARSLARDLVPG
jgi:alkylation response protein AidB-like acyl-CoA dehydrogenase